MATIIWFILTNFTFLQCQAFSSHFLILVALIMLMWCHFILTRSNCRPQGHRAQLIFLIDLFTYKSVSSSFIKRNAWRKSYIHKEHSKKTNCVLVPQAVIMWCFVDVGFEISSGYFVLQIHYLHAIPGWSIRSYCSWIILKIHFSLDPLWRKVRFSASLCCCN